MTGEKLQTRGLVIFGVESCFSVDVIETMARRNFRIIHSITTGEAEWDYDGIDTVDLDEFSFHDPDVSCVVPWMTPGHRYQRTILAERSGLKLADALIDPTAIIPTAISILCGSYVNAGVTIGSHAELHRSVFVNRSASIGHHAILDDFSSVGPGATICARTHIGTGAFVSAGAVIAPGIEVGSNAVIASGASVYQSVPANALVAGNPGKVRKVGIPGHNGIGVCASVK